MLRGLLKINSAMSFRFRSPFFGCAVWFLASVFFCQTEFADERRQDVEIPFNLTGGFLIQFEGQIGELNGLKFVLDTGATHSIVDQRVARRLGVGLHPKKVFDFNNPVILKEGTFSEVLFGPVHLTEAPLLVGKLDELSSAANGADAVIGSDLLLCSRLTIDYQQRRLIFGLSNSSAQVPRQRGLVLRLYVQNVPLDLLVDTGSDSIVLFEDRLPRRIPTLVMQDIKRVMIRPQSHALQATLPAIYLGPREIENRVVLVNGPPANILPGLSGYLGTSCLHPHRIEIDLASDSFRWR